MLVDRFLKDNNEQYRRNVESLSPATMAAFMEYDWPGNVRELENMVRRMVVLGNEGSLLEEIRARDVSTASKEKPENALDLTAIGVDIAQDDVFELKAISRRAAQLAEKRVIEKVLNQTRWNRKEAAEKLQISYKALLYKMKESGLNEGR